MSYILDALKRADADRERGHVPSLRTQPLNTDVPARKHRAAKPWLPWLGVALAGLALLAALSAWWRADTRDASIGPASAPDIAQGQAPKPASDVPPEPSPIAAPDMPALPILSPEPPRVKPPRAPASAAAPAPGSEPASQAGAKSGSESASTTSTSTATIAATPPAPSSSSSIRNFSDLSPEERARLPTVNVSGATYSKNPALRMLIVNGKVSLEGEEVAPGLKLETIEPRTAVLNHQGLRYRIGY